jgi:hypothetical protein
VIDHQEEISASRVYSSTILLSNSTWHSNSVVCKGCSTNQQFVRDRRSGASGGTWGGAISLSRYLHTPSTFNDDSVADMVQMTQLMVNNNTVSYASDSFINLGTFN